MTDASLSDSPSLDHETQACLRLWAAVFAAGIKDAKTAHRKGHTTRNSADLLWIYDSTGGPGSFNWLCWLFNIAPNQAQLKIEDTFDAPR
jgi:hypothetical protein